MALKTKKGYREIAALLRKEWMSDWQAGRKVPTRQALVKRFRTTPVTMQRVMDLLVEEGFIVTRPTVGGFLTEYPPNTCRIGLVFPGHPGAIVNYGWSRNYLANLMAAEAINASADRWQIRYYMDVDTRVGTSQGLARLERDIEDQSLAGLIFSYSPHDLLKRDLIKHPALPTVHYNSGFAGSGLFIQEPTPFSLESELRLIEQAGLDDVAVLSLAQNSPQSIAGVFASVGLTYRPEWVLAVDHYHLEWVANAVAALFSGVKRSHPQALLITDDHLVEATVQALEGMRGTLPRLPQIFGHWNFPLPYTGNLPVTLCGYDANAWMAAAVRLIEDNPVAQPGRIVTKTTTRKVESVAERSSASNSGQVSIEALIQNAAALMEKNT